MEFACDVQKNGDNKEKHGIDFETAQILWEDAFRLEVPARTDDEPRYIVIGKIRDNVWSAIITYRGAKTRIISCRRSRKSEVMLYES